MGRLKIVAAGNSPQAQAQARGRLFEKLMAEVLRHFGYSIDKPSNVNYAGMEIDIEGKAIATNIPLYAECKCYENEVDSPKLQAFLGKFMTMWFKDKRCQGIFIALPGINSHAKGFYREHYEGNSEITIRLMEEKEVLEAIFQTPTVASPDTISKAIDENIGTPGDWLLFYSDKGLFWVQYIIPVGGGIPHSIILFNSIGKPISDRSTIDYLIQLYPELNDFDIINICGNVNIPAPSIHEDPEEIVEVRGSSACFEYQFPANPEYFVGRQLVLAELDSFVTKILNKQTSSRGILFEANSGWGKSSVVLASVARLRKEGHFAVAIDSRSASSTQFILRVVDYALRKFGNFNGLLSENSVHTTITGFDGAVETIINVGKIIEKNSKVLFIFLDQFENIFVLQDVLKRIRDLFLKVCDAETNVVLGFSWKTDLIGLTNEFPYEMRDTIRGYSKHIALDTFSEVETNALLNRLEEELKAPLRKDLRFFLSEFSQGYPWLLKKLCAHVTAQRDTGVSQSDIANSLLNVEELFKEDLRGLSSEEDEALRRIAKAAPISVSELGEEFKPEVVQSLVNNRLVVRIGNKYDVYWDIFRDYLNVGRLPIQENYMLRAPEGSVLKATKLLVEANGILSISEFQTKAGLNERSFYNVARDMRLLGLATVEDGEVRLQINLSIDSKGLDITPMRVHLRDRLSCNRLVSLIIDELKVEGSVTIDELSSLLAKWCPYISATDQTWKIYARVFAGWIDFADLAIFESKEGTITNYMPGNEVRKRDLLLPKRRGGSTIPSIQYTPVEKAALRIVQALQGNSEIDWTGFKKSTRYKTLTTLEDLGFITRKTRSINVLPKALEFVAFPDRRPALFADGALKMRIFAAFVDILREDKEKGRTISQLASELRRKLSVNWKEGTATWSVKIMLDWARHTGLAPDVYSINRSHSKRRYTKKETHIQLPLFSNVI